MPRLPIPEADVDNWGALLNEFLRVAHRENGMLRGTYQVINVRDFGAMGDGNTTDTAALQEAIDSSDPNGGIVFLPPGTYLLTGTLTLPSNVELRGSGSGQTILKVADNTPIDIIKNKDFGNGNTNIIISDLELDGVIG
jgi:polygalacturonase